MYNRTFPSEYFLNHIREPVNLALQITELSVEEELVKDSNGALLKLYTT